MPESAMGLLCVNEGAFAGDAFPAFCGHAAHPGVPCPVSGGSDAGGRWRGCPCTTNRQVSQREEDVLILKRNTPVWEHVRIDRLAASDA